MCATLHISLSSILLQLIREEVGEDDEDDEANEDNSGKHNRLSNSSCHWFNRLGGDRMRQNGKEEGEKVDGDEDKDIEASRYVDR